MHTTTAMRHIPLLWLLFSGSVAHAAIKCNPYGLVGTYAYQLSGTATISGQPQPAVVLGRVTLDQGNITGTSSATYTGLLLGNPVTGTYEANTDCTVTVNLRDDSGGFQRFAGTYTNDYARIPFHQTDSGVPLQGVMLKTSDSCASSDLAKKYSYILIGNKSGKGSIDTVPEGDFSVESDCTVHFTLRSDSEPVMHFRGYLVGAGRQILAIQTDPLTVAGARLTASP